MAARNQRPAHLLRSSSLKTTNLNEPFLVQPMNKIQRRPKALAKLPKFPGLKTSIQATQTSKRGMQTPQRHSSCQDAHEAPAARGTLPVLPPCPGSPPVSCSLQPGAAGGIEHLFTMDAVRKRAPCCNHWVACWCRRLTCSF